MSGMSGDQWSFGGVTGSERLLENRGWELEGLMAPTSVGDPGLYGGAGARYAALVEAEVAGDRLRYGWICEVLERRRASVLKAHERLRKEWEETPVGGSPGPGWFDRADALASAESRLVGRYCAAQAAYLRAYTMAEFVVGIREPELVRELAEGGYWFGRGTRAERYQGGPRPPGKDGESFYRRTVELTREEGRLRQEWKAAYEDERELIHGRLQEIEGYWLRVGWRALEERAALGRDDLRETFLRGRSVEDGRDRQRRLIDALVDDATMYKKAIAAKRAGEAKLNRDIKDIDWALMEQWDRKPQGLRGLFQGAAWRKERASLLAKRDERVERKDALAGWLGRMRERAFEALVSREPLLTAEVDKEHGARGQEPAERAQQARRRRERTIERAREFSVARSL